MELSGSDLNVTIKERDMGTRLDARNTRSLASLTSSRAASKLSIMLSSSTIGAPFARRLLLPLFMLLGSLQGLSGNRCSSSNVPSALYCRAQAVSLKSTRLLGACWAGDDGVTGLRRIGGSRTWGAGGALPLRRLGVLAARSNVRGRAVPTALELARLMPRDLSINASFSRRISSS